MFLMRMQAGPKTRNRNATGPVIKRGRSNIREPSATKRLNRNEPKKKCIYIS